MSHYGQMPESKLSKHTSNMNTKWHTQSEFRTMSRSFFAFFARHPQNGTWFFMVLTSICKVAPYLKSVPYMTVLRPSYYGQGIKSDLGSTPILSFALLQLPALGASAQKEIHAAPRTVVSTGMGSLGRAIRERDDQ